MKIIIDTSVFISALITKKGDARKLLRLVFEKKLYPQMSEALFHEYESVIKRKKILKLSPLDSTEITALFNAFLSTCRWNEIYYMWRPNLNDEDDNFVVELAVASGAKMIITYNLKDFNSAELLFEHKIITPEQFLKEFS